MDRWDDQEGNRIMTPSYTGRWAGKDWPRFRTRSGYFRVRDGAPSIQCFSDCGKQFGITFERWINDRRKGYIIPCAEETRS